MTATNSIIILQVNRNIKSIHDHINKLKNVLQSHRDKTGMEFAVIFEKAQKMFHELDVEFKFKCSRVEPRPA